jgi:hypothetical protein
MNMRHYETAFQYADMRYSAILQACAVWRQLSDMLVNEQNKKGLKPQCCLQIL